MNEDILLVNFYSNLPRLRKSRKNFDYYQIGPLNKIDHKFVCRNDQKRLNKIALKKASSYSSWIASLNNIFINKKLILNSNLSLFYLTDLSNKRSEIFSTFNNVCNIALIKELISKYNYKYLIISGASDDFYQSIKSLKTIKIRKHTSMDLDYFKAKFKNILKNLFLKNLLRHYKLLFNYLIYYFYILRFGRKKTIKNIKANKIFFTRFPLHFKDNVIKEEKYGDLVGINDFFLSSINCDGLHQKINFIDAIKSRIKIHKFGKTKHIVLDDYISLDLILKSFLKSFVYFLRFNDLLNQQYIFEEINLTISIKQELKFSFQRVMGLLLNYELLKLSFKNLEANSFIYYLHEYAYGRMISYFLNQRGELKTYGMQHGPVALKKLLYHLDPNEVSYNTNDYLYSIPLPSNVIAEDLYSKKVYEYFGYRNIKLLDKIPRISYIYNINMKKEKDIILIASGLHDFPFIYQYMLNIISQSSEIFLFKTHPRSKNNLEKYKLPKNANYTNNHISLLLERSKTVFASYSSVAIEAKLLNIPVNLIQYPGIINESSLTDD